MMAATRQLSVGMFSGAVATTRPPGASPSTNLTPALLAARLGTPERADTTTKTKLTSGGSATRLTKIPSLSACANEAHERTVGCNLPRTRSSHFTALVGCEQKWRHRRDTMPRFNDTNQQEKTAETHRVAATGGVVSHRADRPVASGRVLEVAHVNLGAIGAVGTGCNIEVHPVTPYIEPVSPESQQTSAVWAQKRTEQPKES